MRFSKYILLFFLLVTGCSSLSITEGLKINSERDWLQLGKGGGRQNNYTYSEIEPPLKIAWDFFTDAGASPNSMSAADGVLFASTLRGEMYAINIYTGKSLGKITGLGKASFCTPAITLFNSIILTYRGEKESSLKCVNLATGESVWERKTSDINSSAVTENNAAYVSTVKGSILKLDIHSGKVLWESKAAAANKGFYSSPVISNKHIICGNTDGNIYAFDKNTGELSWKYQSGAVIYNDLLISSSTIFFSNENGELIKLSSEGSLIWKKSFDSKLSLMSENGSNIILNSISGKVYSINAESGDIIWEFQTNGSITSAPVINSNKIFITSYDGYLYCLNAISGAELWKHDFGYRLKTTPIIWDKFIFAAVDDKKIYCLTNAE